MDFLKPSVTDGFLDFPSVFELLPEESARTGFLLYHFSERMRQVPALELFAATVDAVGSVSEQTLPAKLPLLCELLSHRDIRSSSYREASSCLPNKGISLPFVSYGGSSLICTLAAVGLLAGAHAAWRPRCGFEICW